MPSSSVTVMLGSRRDAVGAAALIVPLTQKSVTSATPSAIASAALNAALTRIITQGKIDATSSAVTVAVPPSPQSKTLTLVTILPTEYAEKSDLFERIQALRSLGSAIADHAKRSKQKSVVVDTTALEGLSVQEQEGMVEGILLSLYTYDNYRSKSTPLTLRRITLVGNAITKKTLQRATILCDAVCLARDLVNAPARDCTPTKLRATATKVARAGKLSLKVLTSDQLTRMGADLMMSVFRGSNETPYLLQLTYKPRRAKKIVALVGKGVTFDSGGLSIKSGAGMMDMKMDMAGAAAVIATMQAISQLKPEVEVRAYAPVTENMINGSATRPGDVVTSLNGKTVEILNTDAEGRLILGDTLVLAERAKPDVIIDLATLTGAVIAAIGSDYAGLFSPSDKLALALNAAAERSGERLWRLPLAPEYRENLKSKIADIKNIGGSEAGCITAALFLREFVEKTEWAHLDIAGPAFSSSEKVAIPKGGTGFGVRTLVRYIERISQ